MNDDGTLLWRYAVARDEGAFSELVRRHLPFVYSAALRRLGGDAHGAQDVAQRVFCALARNARRVAREPKLGGWLFTATRNAATDVGRTERRRRVREEEATRMKSAEPESVELADWSQLRPVLDAAMDKLQAGDREAVLLRFFQGKSFGEVGAAVGLGEDAARKRVERALTRLREILQRHGVASTSAALAILLANQTVSAAPAAVLASVTGASLASGASAASGLGALVPLTRLQVGIAAAVMSAGAIGLVLQQRAILAWREAPAPEHAGRLKTGGEGERSGSRAVRGEIGKALRRGAPAPAAISRPMVRGQLQAEAVAALQHPNVTEKYFALMAVLQKLSAENWVEVDAAFGEARKGTGLSHPEAFDLFVRRAGEVAGREAVEFLLQRQNFASAGSALMGWASLSPAAALRWLGRDVDAETRQRILGGAIRGLALSEPDLAIKMLEELPVKDRAGHAGELASSMVRAAGLDRAQAHIENMLTRANTAGIANERYLKQVFSDYAVLRIRQSSASGELPQAVEWLNRHIGQPHLDHQVIAEAAGRLAARNPQETFRWLEGVNAALLRAGSESTAGYRVLLDAWMVKEGQREVDAWLRGQAGHPHYDHLAWQYAALIASRDSASAATWAATIRDPAIRSNVLQLIQARTAKGSAPP